VPAQDGQTLVIFALVLALFFTWMIALVADLGSMLTAYNRFDNAALLAAQAGASTVDLNQLYNGRLSLDVNAAKSVCADSLNQAGVSGSCDGTTNSRVVATVDGRVNLPVTILGRQAQIHVQRFARPAYGFGQGMVTTG
jgi:Flp pilus assembly protein TadG